METHKTSLEVVIDGWEKCGVIKFDNISKLIHARDILPSMNIHDAQKIYEMLHSVKHKYLSGISKLFQFDWFNTRPYVLRRLNLHPFITNDSDIYTHDDFDTFAVLISGKLEKDGFDKTKILTILEATRSYIVGSYITEAISNDIWNTECIDILHCGPVFPKDLEDYFTSIGYIVNRSMETRRSIIRVMNRNERRHVRITVSKKEPIGEYFRRIDLNILYAIFPCSQLLFNSKESKMQRHMIENKEMIIITRLNHDEGMLKMIVKFIRRGFLMKNWNMVHIKENIQLQLRWNLTVFMNFDCNRQNSPLPILVRGEPVFDLGRIINCLEYLRDTEFEFFMENIYPAVRSELEYCEFDEKNDTDAVTSITYDFSEMEYIQKTACGEVIIGNIDKKNSYCMTAKSILDPFVYDAKINTSNEGQLDKILFECIRHTDERQAINIFNPFLKIFVDSSGSSGLVKLAQYREARYHHLRYGRKSMYIRPVLDSAGNPVKILRLTSLRNSGISPSAADYFSANHCQAGTDMGLYQIIVCKGDQCL